MNRPMAVALKMSGGNLNHPLGWTLMERLSFRPKTVAAPILAAVGMGVFYSLNLLLSSSRSKERSRERKPLWDFFDPTGHHEIVD